MIRFYFDHQNKCTFAPPPPSLRRLYRRRRQRCHVLGIPLLLRLLQLLQLLQLALADFRTGRIQRRQTARIERRILVRFVSEHLRRIDATLCVLGRLGRRGRLALALLFGQPFRFSRSLCIALAEQRLAVDQLDGGWPVLAVLEPHAQIGQHLVAQSIAQLQDVGGAQIACLLADRVAEGGQRGQVGRDIGLELGLKEKLKISIVLWYNLFLFVLLYNF